MTNRNRLIAFSALIAAAQSFRSGLSQEALRTAVSLDKTLEEQRAPVRMAPDEIHFGPVLAKLSFNAQIQYDDNVTLSSENRESDILLRGMANARFLWPVTERSNLQFGAGLGYIYYTRGTTSSGPEVGPDTALTYNFSIGDVVVTLFDQFDYLREARTEGSLANISNLSRGINNAGARVRWEPDAWFAETGYSHYNYFSESATYAYLNRASEFLFARFGWNLAEKTSAGIESSGSITAYKNTPQNDHWNVSVGPFANWQARESLRIEARSGPTFTQFDRAFSTTQSSTLSTYYAGLTATHQITANWGHRIGVNRFVEPGLNQGSAFIEQLTAEYSMTYALTPFITVSTGLVYEHGRQPLPVLFPSGVFVEQIEEFDRFVIAPELSWRTTDHFRLGIRMSHIDRKSNLDGRNYIDNLASFQIEYTF